MQPFIIFGTRGRTSTVEEGEFFCPQCQQQREYERKRARNYFSLYFVPLIPLGEGQEFVECSFCHNAFDPTVLLLPPQKRPIPLAEQLNGLKERLEAGTPVEYALRDLTAAGLDRDMALQMVQQQIGEVRQQCPTCGLSYADGVPTCAEDGTALS